MDPETQSSEKFVVDPVENNNPPLFGQSLILHAVFYDPRLQQLAIPFR